MDYVNYGLWSNIDFEHIYGLPYHSVVQDANGKSWRWIKSTEATKSNVVLTMLDLKNLLNDL